MNKKTILFFTILICLFHLFSCQEEKNMVSHNILKKRVDFDKKEAIKYADIIVENQIYVWKFWEPYKYTKQINWENDPYNNPSWVLYLHSLRMVGILSRAYEFKKDDRYINKSIEIIKSWNTFDTGKKKYWYDHMVANRVLNISHFFYLVKEQLSLKDQKLILDILKTHGNWLEDDKNYTRGNHAIMLDRALLQLSLTMDNSIWYDKASKRANEIFEEEITQEGVCVENSPGYHQHVMDLVNDFIVLHKNFEKKSPSHFSDKYLKMQDYLVYLIKPNNKYPALGDTYYSEFPLMLSKKYDSDNLLFIDTKGIEGIKPKKTSIVYPESGYTIFRDGWNKGKSFSESTYMILTNTNQSLVHKHSDNLSFELYANNEDLIVDPGTMGYKIDQYRNYLTSTIAHNTLNVDEMHFNHKFIEQNTSASIKSIAMTDSYNLVNLLFSPNKELTFSRDVLFIKPNIFVFKDIVKTSNPNCYSTYSQTFNFSKAIHKIDSKNKERVVARFKENELLILQKGAVDSATIFDGVENLRGVIANGALKNTKTKQLVFNQRINGKESMFLTAFVINNSLENNIKETDLSISIKNNNIFVNWLVNDRNEQIKL